MSTTILRAKVRGKRSPFPILKPGVSGLCGAWHKLQPGHTFPKTYALPGFTWLASEGDHSSPGFKSLGFSARGYKASMGYDNCFKNQEVKNRSRPVVYQRIGGTNPFGSSRVQYVKVRQMSFCLRIPFRFFFLTSFSVFRIVNPFQSGFPSSNII
jgi:hypothetical protein